MTVHPLPTGNAKHQVALAAQADQLVALRAEVTDTVVILVGLAHELEAMTDSRHRVRARLVTEETRQIFEKQTRLDRDAARGLVGRVTDPGLTWLNTAARIGTGQVEAPVQTMPALSVVAEIRYTLRHHVRRLGRPAKLVALEHEQTLEEDHGYCPWPRSPILTAGINDTDHGVTHLAARLLRLVETYTNRRDLDALKRDLERLEEAALDVTEGMAGRSALPIGSETCPHCGRNTLALLSRVEGVKALVVRCEGTHRCECTWEFCECHRNPRKNRHEWINSGSAAHTFHELHNLQTKRKELTILETKALDAIDVIRALHQPVWRAGDDSQNAGQTAPAYVWLTGDGIAVPDDHQCIDDWHSPDGNTHVLGCFDQDNTTLHAVPVCTTCGDAGQTGDLEDAVLWPCPTYLACDLDAQHDDPSPTDSPE